MRSERDDEQRELAATVRTMLDRRSDSAAVRAAMSSEPGYDVGLWRDMCTQIGVAGLPVPERYDGAGASLAETAVVLEELGANLAPSPLLASALVVADLLLHGTERERAERLPRVAGGEVVAFSLGDLVLEPADAAPAMDPTLRLARGDGDAPAEDLRAIAAALVSALQVGTMRRGLEMTVAHSKRREQFGRPIGSFQALKHRMADMLVLLEASRSASRAAAAAAAAYVSEPSADRERTLRRSAAIARAYCSDALEHVAAETIQLHGGIAITWEHDAHLVLKRAHALAQLVGPAHCWRAAVLD